MKTDTYKCECGCGAEIEQTVYYAKGRKWSKRFVHGHQNKVRPLSPLYKEHLTAARKIRWDLYHANLPQKHCECGCGEIVKQNRQYVRGHSRRGKTQVPWNKGKNTGQTSWSKGLRGEEFKKHFKKGKPFCWFDTDEHRTKNNQYREDHSNAVSEEVKRFREDGYRCIRTDKKPIPDFIAIKDGKAFAVEVEFTAIKPSKYYQNNPSLEYSDIIWIKKEREKGQE